MDGDGEDLGHRRIGPILCMAYERYPDNVITANRIKRSEGFIFRFCYLAHKYLTFIFSQDNLLNLVTYTCLPQHVVKKMINEPATWSSFSGSLAKLEKIENLFHQQEDLDILVHLK